MIGAFAAVISRPPVDALKSRSDAQSGLQIPSLAVIMTAGSGKARQVDRVSDGVTEPLLYMNLRFMTHKGVEAIEYQ